MRILIATAIGASLAFAPLTQKPTPRRAGVERQTTGAVVDGKPIFESLAILIYLGETHGVDKGLYPPPGLERAEVLQWMVWSTATLVSALLRVMQNKSDRFPAEEHNENAAAAGLRELSDLFGILDRALEGKEYLCGGRFTLADLAVVAFLPMASRFGADTNPHKNIVAWSGRCMSRRHAETQASAIRSRDLFSPFLPTRCGYRIRGIQQRLHDGRNRHGHGQGWSKLLVD